MNHEKLFYLIGFIVIFIGVGVLWISSLMFYTHAPEAGFYLGVGLILIFGPVFIEEYIYRKKLSLYLL